MNRIYISPSKLISFGLCPYKQKNAKFTESEATRFGSAVDAGIEAWLLGEDFQSVFATTGAKNGLEMTTDIIERGLKCFATLRAASESWLNIETCNLMAVQSKDLSGLVKSEHIAEFYGKKFWQVPIGGTWGLRGATDMIDWYINDSEQTILRIIDWKTGFTQADDIQLACYAIMAWQLYKDFAPDLIETRFFYLDQGGTSPSSVWTKETLVSAYKLVEARALAFIEGQKLAEQPRTINKYCSYCEFKNDCPKYKNVIEHPVATAVVPYKADDIADIVAKIEDISKVKKIINNFETELKNARESLILDAGGTIETETETYTLKEVTSTYEYDLAAIFEESQDVLKRPPLECMKFDNAKFNAMLKGVSKPQAKILKGIMDDNKTPKSSYLKFSKKITPKKIIEPDTKVFGRCLSCDTVHEFHNGTPEPCRKCGAVKFQLGKTLGEVSKQ